MSSSRGSSRLTNPSRGLGYGERRGIQEGHAYSVMRAVEIDGERLLLLKNPWGKGEWTGPWSMSFDLWHLNDTMPQPC